jgi:hypothetical protein
MKRPPKRSVVHVALTETEQIAPAELSAVAHPLRLCERHMYDRPLRRSFHDVWLAVASLARAGFIGFWLLPGVSAFRSDLARVWHGSVDA